jgi:methionine-rich copper-binding protein CopC
MTKRLLLAFAAVLAILVPAAPAWAHNALVEASPAKNATLKTAPTTVKLRFLEKLPDSTRLSVTGPDGTAPAQSAAKISGATISVTFPEPLGNGAYTVAYQVAGEDGHLTKSSYRFTVAAPVASPSAAPSPSAEVTSPSAATTAVSPAGLAPVSAAEDADDSNGPWLGLAAGIGILVLAGAAVFVFMRRRAAK